MKTNVEAHWRDSARKVKFFGLDGSAAFPILLFLVKISWFTFYIVIISVTFFAILSRFGFTPIVFLRIIRSKLAGSRVIANPWWLT